MSTEKQVIYTAQQLIDNLLSTKGQYFLHPKGSVYLGLTLEQQRVLSKMRRGPGRVPTWRTKEMHAATKRDYEKLLLHCTETLIQAWHNPKERLDKIDVYVRLPFNWRAMYDKDIPRAVVLAYDDWSVTVSWKIDKIVDWLHSIGHSHYTASDLRKTIWAVLKEQEKLDLYYEYASVGSILELYGCIVNDNKDKKKVLRKNKGRKVTDKSVDKQQEV